MFVEYLIWIGQFGRCQLGCRRVPENRQENDENQNKSDNGRRCRQVFGSHVVSSRSLSDYRNFFSDRGKLEKITGGIY
jgi:hypothetical protein